MSELSSMLRYTGNEFPRDRDLSPTFSLVDGSGGALWDRTVHPQLVLNAGDQIEFSYTVPLTEAAPVLLDEYGERRE